jgi:site-specific recombinase XerD
MSITLSQAIEGYYLDAQSRRLSEHTLADYGVTFRKLQDFLKSDPPLASITAEHIRQFLGDQDVSKKTVLNYHTGLTALWTWATQARFVPANVVRDVTPPRPEQRVIEPFSEADVRAMLSMLGRSRSYSRPGKRESDHVLGNADRNRCILLVLLDTGVRASELCGLQAADVDLRNQRIRVFGKGDKERSLPMSAETAKALWRYMVQETKGNGDASVFRMGRDYLCHLIRRIGERAGVPNAHPHRFRHTFATQYLRNGGDVYTLQTLLGHTTMEMVRVYLMIAQTDTQEVHRKASPVSNWKL